MGSSPGSESSESRQELEEELRNPEFLRYFDLPEEYEGDHSITKRDSADLIDYYTVSFEGQGASERFIMIFPLEISQNVADCHFQANKQAFRAAADNVLKPLAMEMLPSKRYCLVFQSRATAFKRIPPKQTFAALQRLHELSTKSQSGFVTVTELNGCQNWSEWFQRSIIETLSKLGTMYRVEPGRLNGDRIKKLTNHLLSQSGVNDQDKLGLVHRNLQDHDIETQNDGQDKVVFYNFDYVYGPKEWILTTGSKYKVGDDVDTSMFVYPSDQGQSRLRLYTAYKKLHDIVTRQPHGQYTSRKLQEPLDDLEELATSFQIS